MEYTGNTPFYRTRSPGMPDGCLHQNRLHEHIGGNHETVCEKQNQCADEHSHHGNLSKFLNLNTPFSAMYILLAPSRFERVRCKVAGASVSQWEREFGKWRQKEVARWS